MKTAALAGVCSFAGLLEWAAFESHFMQTGSMTTLGLMVGIVAAAGRHHDASTDADGEPSAARLIRTVP